jgi:hypothetical protein
MSEITISSGFFISLVSVAGLWIMLFWFYRDYRVDAFRQELFALRDSLYDYADQGHILFEHKAYGQLRSAMNGFIRFGHRVSLLQAILFLIFGRSDFGSTRNDFDENWESALKELDSDVRSAMENYRKQMNWILVQHLVASSPILVASIIVPLFLWAVGKYSLDSFLRRLRHPLNGMDSAAMAYGCS